MPLFLGVDAGGTKTHAVLVNEQGVLVHEATSGPGNPLSAGDDAALGALQNAVHQTLSDDARSKLAGAHFGMAGAGRPADARKALRLAKALELPCPVSVSDDAKISFYSAADPPGAVLISGTGSIAVAYTKAGEEHRAGGHGYLLGDEGSGYWIGRELVRETLRAADGRNESTALTESVPRLLGFSSLDEVVSAVYAGDVGRADIAALASGIVDLEGPTISKILDEAANELVLCVQAVLYRAGIEDDTPNFVLSGGLLSGDTPLRARVEDRLLEALPGARIPRKLPAPALGAARLARLEHGGFA